MKSGSLNVLEPSGPVQAWYRVLLYLLYVDGSSLTCVFFVKFSGVVMKTWHLSHAAYFFVCVTDCNDCLRCVCVCIREVIVQPMDIVRVLIEVSYDVRLS